MKSHAESIEARILGIALRGMARHLDRKVWRRVSGWQDGISDNEKRSRPIAAAAKTRDTLAKGLRILGAPGVDVDELQEILRIDIQSASAIGQHWKNCKSLPVLRPNLALHDAAQIACRAWGFDEAGSLAAWWLGKTEFDFTGRKMNIGRITILVGVAAAAVALVVAWALRHGRRVQPRDTECLTPSKDYRGVHSLTRRNDELGMVAQNLLEGAKDPTQWNLLHEIGKLDDTALVVLFQALAEKGLCNVITVTPARGDRYEPTTMVGSVDTDSKDIWVVTDLVNPGFRVQSESVVRAEVEVSTLDWWVLTKSECEVGREILARAQEIAPDRHRWRAELGFRHPQDLRELFGEIALDLWRNRMIEELNPAYSERPDKQLRLVGERGATFELSTMEAFGDEPLGDVIVSEVRRKDGVPQYGLVCRGGNPLLFAVVTTKPKE